MEKKGLMQDKVFEENKYDQARQIQEEAQAKRQQLYFSGNAAGPARIHFPNCMSSAQQTIAASVDDV